MLKSLTSLRFVFAVMVFLSHTAFVSDPTSCFFVGKYLFKQGFVGVNFFFILSGFILSYTYFDKFQELKVTDIKRFYFKRFLKIYPSYWFSFFLSFYFAQELWTNSQLREILFSNLFLLQAWIPDKMHQWFLNPPSWSLSVEVFFYLLFPFIIRFAQIASKRRFIALVFMAFVFQLCITIYFKESDTVKFWFYLFPITNLILFLSGIALYILYRNYHAFLSKKINTTMEVISLFLFAAAVYYSQYIPDNLKFICYYLPFAALIVFVFSFQNGKISEYLSHPLPEYLGKISFQFYLIHFLAIWFWCKMDYLYLKHLSQSLIVLFSFITTLLISFITYHSIELPFQKKFK